uniref:Uncharacterized protein n=1 Tax=Arundo donax TaxID=35708 RepID=A0A0A8YQS1_ARUDO
MFAEAAPSSAIRSRHRDMVSFDCIRKFWSALSPHTWHELLRIDNQIIVGLSRRNLYCSRLQAAKGCFLKGLTERSSAETAEMLFVNSRNQRT